MRTNIEKYTDEMINSTNGIISITVINADGLVVAYNSKNKSIDNQLAASFQIEVLRQIARGLNYVDELDNKEVLDVSITLKDQLHLVSSSESRELVTHIIANAHEANEGMIKTLNKKFKPLLDS